MNCSSKGLLLGAGASYEIGMPLAREVTAELKGWLTPEKLRILNAGWRVQGTGFRDRVVDDLAHSLQVPEKNYEEILGHLETEYRRNSEFRQEYHGLYSWLVEVVYHILHLWHAQSVEHAKRYLRYYEGILRLVSSSLPLWVFSLNHDLVTEVLAAHYRIPLNCGFSDERVTLPLRNKHGLKTGDLLAEVLSGEEVERGAFHFFQPGMRGINLLKMHGSLDVFTFRDGKDLLRLLPSQGDALGVIEVLRAANEGLIYVDSASPNRVVKTTNEITYADDNGEMQFLRRSLSAGAHKFDSRVGQVLPFGLLNSFTAHLNCLSSLVCIGYGFGDIHINNVIETWLEASTDHNLEIVTPPEAETKHSFPPLVAPQVVLRRMTATEYLDSVAQIERTPRDYLEKCLLKRRREQRNRAARA